MSINRVELVGRVGWVDIKYLESGTVITKVTVAMKNGKKTEDDKDDYDSFFVTYMNKAESKNNIAEEIGDRVKKGDYIRVIGSLQIDKFTPKGSDKPVENISIKGWKYSKVEYDPTTRSWVDLK